MSRRFLGLTGYAGVGKDEVAKILHEEFGFEPIAIADPIRAIVFQLDPLVLLDPGDITETAVRFSQFVDAFGWTKAKKDPEVRRLLQVTGDALRDTFGEDVLMRHAASRMSERDGWYVVTDIRNGREWTWLKVLGGPTWRVSRPGVGPANEHRTERQVDEVPASRVVWNDGTLEMLRRRVVTMIEEGEHGLEAAVRGRRRRDG